MEKGEGAHINRAVTPGGHPLDQTQPAFPVYHRKFANPAPLGLCGFALTTFMLSLINVEARGVSIPNVVTGSAFAYGGLAQLLAGMWEFACGNTFGATAFSSYGAFWISYAITISPWSGVADAYAEASDPNMEANGVSFFLWGWFIFTFIMLVAAMRSSGGLIAVFFFLTITFLLLAIGEYGYPSVTVAGGAFGIITAFCAWYVALAGLLTPETSFFVLPTFDIPNKN